MSMRNNLQARWIMSILFPLIFLKAGMTLTYDPTTAALQNGYVKCWHTKKKMFALWKLHRTGI